MTEQPPKKASQPLDPRRNAYRPDLAALSLSGAVDAPNYAPGAVFRVVQSAVPLRRRPDLGSPIDTEVLFGETVIVYDETDGWGWVQLEQDRYVGYLPADVLSAKGADPTHRVKALGTFVYPAPDIKSPPLMHLALNSLLVATGQEGMFTALAGGGFVATRHVTEKDRYARDFAEIAERLIGTPYLWGGRTRVGIDCSGLVQTALAAAGLPCPRDSDMQEAELGAQVLVPDSLEGLKRGDLVFWKGHVGIMADGLMLVHANAHHMSVVVETLPEAAKRIARQGSKITSIRRLPALSAVVKV